MKMDTIKEMAANKAAPIDAVAIAATLHTMLHDAESIHFWVHPDALDAFRSVKAAHKHCIHDIADAAILFDSLPDCFDSFLTPPSDLVTAIDAARRCGDD